MKTDRINLLTRIATGILLLFACFFMYDFYKCLSGFIANGFREPLVMLPMILAFLLPVLCFLFFFYDFYVRDLNSVVKLIYRCFVAVYAVVDLVLIFSNISIYASNNALGVYDSLPSIVLHFPYDMIVILITIAVMQVLSIFFVKPGTEAEMTLSKIKQTGAASIGIVEYIAICVMAIIVFVFTGAAITATFTAFANAFYDFRFVFLILWVMLIPMANLLLIALKPEKTRLSKRNKMIILGSGIGANVIFGLLFLIFELSYPDFLVHIGKPLFLIAFSVSMPIEPALILAIMLIGTVTFAVRILLLLVRDTEIKES